jgi:MFS-type transporter involved in bile tolerance (Atg22 family)
MNQPVAGSKLRSAGAVLAGLIAIFVLSLGIDAVLHALGVYPPWDQPISDKQALLATSYRIVCAIAGCFLAAWLAPRRPMRHALALGVIGVLLSTAGAIATWNRAPAMGPHWYPIALIVTALPCAWLGGRLVPGRAES